MPIYTGCIPDGIACLVIYDEGDSYLMKVWNSFGMFAEDHQGDIWRTELQDLISIAHLYGFVLEEV